MLPSLRLPSLGRFWPVALVLFLCVPAIVLLPRGMPVWLIALALAALPVIFAARRNPLPAAPWRWLWLSSLIFVGASAVWSPSARAAVTALEIAYVVLCGSLAVAALRAADDEIRRGLIAFLLAGFVVGAGLWAIEILWVHPIHRWFNGGLPVDAFLSPNMPKRTEALLALAIWPVAYALWQRGTAQGGSAKPGGGFSVWRAAGYALPFLLIGVYAAEATSRSAMLALAIGIAVAVAARFAPTLMRRGIFIFLALAMVAVPLAATQLPQIPKSTFHSLFLSAIDRLDIWAATGRDIAAAPLQGNGIDATRALGHRANATPQADPMEWRVLSSAHPHNGFLQVWAELGAVGALLSLALAYGFFRALRRLAKPAQVFALGAIATGIVLLSFAYGLWQAWWMAGHVAAGLLFLLHPREEV